MASEEAIGQNEEKSLGEASGVAPKMKPFSSSLSAPNFAHEGREVSKSQQVGKEVVLIEPD